MLPLPSPFFFFFFFVNLNEYITPEHVVNVRGSCVSVIQEALAYSHERHSRSAGVSVLEMSLLSDRSSHCPGWADVMNNGLLSECRHFCVSTGPAAFRSSSQMIIFLFYCILISLMGAEDAREMIWTELKTLEIIRECSLPSVPLPSHILGYETTRAVFVKWIKIHLHSHLSPSCMYLLNLV